MVAFLQCLSALSEICHTPTHGLPNCLSHSLTVLRNDSTPGLPDMSTASLSGALCKRKCWSATKHACKHCWHQAISSCTSIVGVSQLFRQVIALPATKWDRALNFKALNASWCYNTRCSSAAWIQQRCFSDIEYLCHPLPQQWTLTSHIVRAFVLIAEKKHSVTVRP